MCSRRSYFSQPAPVKLRRRGLGALLSPIGLVVAGLGVLAAWFATSTEAGGKALAWLSDKFNQLAAIAKDAFGGIKDALAAGDLQLAAQILWTGLKLAWAVGTEELRKKWIDFKAGFVKVAAAAFYGAWSIAAKAFYGIAEVSAWAAKQVKSVWRAALGTVSSYFADVGREQAKQREQMTLGMKNVKTGKIVTQADIDAAKGEIDRQHDRQEQLRRGGEMADEAEAQAALAKKLADIEAERQATLDKLTKAEMALSEAASTNADEEKAALEKQIADLKKQLESLRGQAAAERKAMDLGGGPGATTRPAIPSASELSGIVKNVMSRGTFNALAVQSLMGGGDEVAKNTAKTVTLLDRIYRRQVAAGATFM